MSWRSLICLLTLAVTCGSSLGCVYALRAPLASGSAYDHESSDLLRPGMTRDEVLGLLGPPLVMTVDAWYYYSFDSQKSCDVYLFGFLKLRQAPSSTVDTEVRFKGGVVSSSTSRRRAKYLDPKYELPQAPAPPPGQSR